jgi:hypothetical protein
MIVRGVRGEVRRVWIGLVEGKGEGGWDGWGWSRLWGLRDSDVNFEFGG